MLLRRLGAAAAVVAVAAAAFLAVTLASDGDDAPRPPAAEKRGGPEGGPEGAGRTPEAGSADRWRVRAAALPLSERVAQVFMVGFEGTGADSPVLADLRSRPWGAVVIGPENVPAIGGLAALAAELEAAAAAAGAPAPLRVAAELPAFPRQAALRGPAAVRAATREAGATLAAAGIEAVLAPQADLAVPAGPAADAGFSDDPVSVARLARAAVAGWLAGGVLPAVGHFPGQGGASQAPIEGPAIVAAAPEVDAFTPALRRAPAVVVSNAAYLVYDSVTPAALLPAVVQGTLRRELGFDGVVVTDDLAGAAAATGGTIGAAAVQALQAGADMVQVRDPAERRAAHAEVLAAVRAGDVPADRLLEAVGRVLELKGRARRGA